MGVISNIHLPPGHCWFCSLLSGVLALATCRCRKTKTCNKNTSTAIFLNHQPILYHLTILQTVGNKKTHTQLFVFVLFSCWTVQLVDIQVGFSKNTHKQKKTFHRVFSRSPETQWSCKNCTSLVKRCWSSSPCA